MDSLAVYVFQENDKETAPISKCVLNRDQAVNHAKIPLHQNPVKPILILEKILHLVLNSL